MITYTREKNLKRINIFVYAAAKSLQSYPTLCDPIVGSPPGSPVRGILQARTLEWVAISFSNAWKWKVKVKSFSHVRLLATQWIAAHQAPPFMGFSRQEYWSGVPLPSPIYMCIYTHTHTHIYMGFPGDSDGKKSACNVGGLGSVPVLGRSPGEGDGCPWTEDSGGLQSTGSQSWTQLGG